MGKKAVISTRIDAALKKDVNDIFNRIGISANEAINIFYKIVKQENGLPFDNENKKKEVWPPIDELEKGIDLVYCKDPDELTGKF